jgi:hypothetical protein
MSVPICRQREYVLQKACQTGVLAEKDINKFIFERGRGVPWAVVTTPAKKNALRSFLPHPPSDGAGQALLEKRRGITWAVPVGSAHGL